MYKKLISFITILGSVWVMLSTGLNWIETVNGYDGRINSITLQVNKNTDALAKQENTLTRMDYNVQIIGRKIGVRPLSKPDGE